MSYFCAVLLFYFYLFHRIVQNLWIWPSKKSKIDSSVMLVYSTPTPKLRCDMQFTLTCWFCKELFFFFFTFSITKNRQNSFWIEMFAAVLFISFKGVNCLFSFKDICILCKPGVLWLIFHVTSVSWKSQKSLSLIPFFPFFCRCPCFKSFFFSL